jgi:hypothetical protein
MKATAYLLGIVVASIVLVGMSEQPPAAEQEPRYDFRASTAYAALSERDREHLEQATRDFTLLWGALDMYGDDHGGEPPDTLDALVPIYLRQLPVDPFATAQGADEQGIAGYETSLDGRGYLYRRGAPGNRAWIVGSVGLPEFPYLAARGNIGLYRCKGTWISGVNPLRRRTR